METIEQLKTHYQWNDQVEAHLMKLERFGDKYKAEFIERLYDYLATFEDTRTYLPDDQVMGRHKGKLMQWFAALFARRHDAQYMRNLYRIGEVHVKLGLPPHYVNASMDFVRRFVMEKLTIEFGRTEERDVVAESVNKLLDINLDVMTSSYREEELKLYLASGKYQKMVIENVRRASWFFDVFIVVALAVSGLFLITRISAEVWSVLMGDVSLEGGAVSIMGSMLILYAISELLAEGIRHIRGGALGLKVFVTVALAAIIRKILIVSLAPEQIQELFALTALVLSLGVTYWLIRRAEEKA
jgi:uncharacterized membrane protein (DUF373 family)